MGVHEGSWTPMVIPSDPAAGRRRNQRGSMTAEAAAVVPVLVAVAIGLVWLVALAAAQVRVVDAAREVARAAARGDADAVAVARGRQVAPSGTRFSISRSGTNVEVTPSAQVRGPGGLFGFLPGVEVRADASTLAEPR